MDRPPLPPSPAVAVEPPTEVLAAVEAFARALDSSDPIVAAFNMTPTAMVVSDPTLPDNPIIYVNPGFEQLTGFGADEVIGRNCRFMQGPLTDAADVAILRDAIARRERVEIDLLNHRRDGTPFWNRLMVAPVFDRDGALRYFVASQSDVTIERHRMRQLEQDREALAEAVARRDADLAAHNARLRMAQKMGGLGTWTLALPDFTLTASSSCKRNFGYPTDAPFDHATFETAVHPEDLPRVREAIRRTIEEGHAYEIEYRIFTPDGEQRWVGIHGELQRRADGTPLSMTGFSTDISDRKFAEEHRAVLARELTHRVKNTLATVGAVVSQTLREARSLTDAMAVVSGRIATLGSAHELLIQDEVEGAAIPDIVKRALAPFTDREGHRFAVSGPSVRLTPEITLALSMALHELATNAVKYGALSVPEGRVAVEWSIRDDAGERRLFFCWGEHDGPPVVPPEKTGFGTRMIERMLRKHVRDGAAIHYLPEGVRFEIEVTV